MELGSLIKAARAGAHVQFELADTEECLTVSQARIVVGVHMIKLAVFIRGEGSGGRGHLMSAPFSLCIFSSLCW